MQESKSVREEFARSVAADEVDLARVALLIAAEETAGVDVDAAIAELDALADAARASMGGAAGAKEIVSRFHAFFFREQGFRGNDGDYYDPRNSYLNDVLERRTGIPISLAVVYLEIARRLGFPVRGIGFPGHFLCKWELDQEEEVVVDPFHGSIVSEGDLRRLLDRLFSGQIAFRPALLTPLSNRGILVRMLANLKGIWVRKTATAGDDATKREHLLRAIGASDRILMLTPDALSELRDRGLLWLKLECARPALADLERYIALAPGANDAKMIAGQVLHLRDVVERIC